MTTATETSPDPVAEQLAQQSNELIDRAGHSQHCQILTLPCDEGNSMPHESIAYVPLSAVAREIPSAQERCEHVNPATVWRWCHRGVSTRKGRVKLAAVKLGNSWFTTRVWLDEFFAKLDKSSNDKAESEPQPVKKPTRRRKSATDQAGEQLEKMGA